ncbi:sialoadhesin-like isoform X2 [Pangasianodon hypophthalmus]|uniref:sialoadhesin-like isoform X2 n=1 Tax=Pangasianodon hypophthalmus TaxID=310915 RepID=UPI00230727CF|nr:sialoadhesin-like isoform X2 [Pangasianodon hypophthalmus]
MLLGLIVNVFNNDYKLMPVCYLKRFNKKKKKKTQKTRQNEKRRNGEKTASQTKPQKVSKVWDHFKLKPKETPYSVFTVRLNWRTTTVQVRCFNISSENTQSSHQIQAESTQVIFASAFSDVWKAEVVSPVEALVSSCVVLPCKFNYPGLQRPDSRLKGIWHKDPNKNERDYDEDPFFIEDNFKGRTKLIGRLSEKNCLLEIDEVRDHDDGPFCFRAEITNIEKFSFVEKCVTINMKPEPDKPNLDHEESFTEGTAAVFKCYVRHTCPTHHPTIEWNRQDVKPRLSYKDNGFGVWEVESLLIVPATEKDNHTDITCTVTFHGNKKSAVTHKIEIDILAKQIIKQGMESSLQSVTQVEGSMIDDWRKHHFDY